MIIEKISNEDILGNKGEFKVTQYYGESALDFACSHKREDIKQWLKHSLFKDCIIKNQKGVVIGVEDNEEFNDYYLIIFIPETAEILFELDCKPVHEIIIK